MRIFLLFSLLFCNNFLFAGKVSGKISDEKNQPLSFSSILVKGTIKGASANSFGEYSIQLEPGNYTLVAQHVGYKSIEQKITVTNADQTLNFVLPEQQYDLGNVTVKQGEDPAYEIIRKTIKKKKDYENEIKKFQSEVYIKGQLKLRNFPKKFMGEKIDFEDGDSSKKKMLFLSETVATYSVEGTKKKVEVTSTKVSGNSNGFGFSSPQIFSFYENTIMLGNLNPRGFISPIATAALYYYNYKFEGTFFENNKMISRIRVTPKRKYEPLFNGYINILEDEWRIHSTQLTLYKENQMQLVDTLRIEQLYVPAGKVWIIKQQTIYPAIKMFGFDAHGSFLQVYDKVNLNPTFPKNFFNNTILKYYDSSNKKTLGFWDTIRPIPLLEEEVKDYKKKDSLEQLRKDPKYLDSIDRKRNKPNIISLINSGQTFGREKNKIYVQVDALLDVVNYNTVEGLAINLSPRVIFQSKTQERKSLSITPNLRYGFSNEHFNAHLTTTYTYGKTYRSSVTLAGGKRVFQFDNNNPIRSRTNTFSTLYWERNYLKIYEAVFGRASITKGFGDGFTLGGSIQYQDRSGLENTTDYKWRDIPERFFKPNIFLPDHQALQAGINVLWQPGSKYIELPERKISVGSKYPTLSLNYIHGVKSVFGSDVDFGKWRFEVSDNLNMKLYGAFNYRVSTGGFVYNNASFLPDFQHYLANQYLSSSPFLSSFQLMPFYIYSNTEKLSSTAHVEYHLNGFLTNKIPLFKKLNWFLVGGANLMYTNKNLYYNEAFVGLENILKILRVDYVQTISKSLPGQTSGIRFSVPFFLRGED